MRRLFLLLALLAVPGSAAAQSSQFGTRGLGLPGRALSVRGLATGGGFGLFDAESSLNPAALGGVTVLTSLFTGIQEFRRVENPAGDASLRGSAFPQVAVVGPIRRLPVTLGASYSGYAGRDFSLATVDTLPLRDEPVEVNDTLTSRGGLSEIRLAGAYRAGGGWTVGAGFHVITGSSRLRFRRTFGDTAYAPLQQRSEVSYAGIGVSLGLVRRLGGNLAVAALARSDGHVDIDRDSLRVGRTDLPYTFGLGVRWRPTPRLDIGSQGLVRTWSGANSDLLEQGAPGAVNTFEVALGAEYLNDPRRPYRRPIRVGVHYGTLPFLVSGQVGRARELGIALGSGTRFAAQRAGVDLAVERLWRWAEDFSEQAWQISVGVSVRP